MFPARIRRKKNNSDPIAPARNVVSGRALNVGLRINIRTAVEMELIPETAMDKSGVGILPTVLTIMKLSKPGRYVLYFMNRPRSRQGKEERDRGHTLGYV
jgi:hypothetical protein